MIWGFSLRQLVIATALIFIFGTVNLHAEQKSDIEAVTAANLELLWQIYLRCCFSRIRRLQYGHR
jgi:hypothetical protein